MRALEIVASIADKSAGPSYTVPRLGSALAVAGAHVSLCSLGEPGESELNGMRHFTFGADFQRVPALSQLGISSAMRASLFRMARDVDVVHAHGLWRMSNIYPARAAGSARRAFVLSPRGMLGTPALEFSKLRKKLFWMAMQRDAAESATMFHATSDQEADDIRTMGLSNPIAIIPNGVDVPPYVAHSPDRSRTVLSLGRIHPKKGLDRLVRAWAELGSATEGWRLRIIGPSEDGHADELRALVTKYRLTGVHVEAPAYGDKKLTAYRAADVFVLPTLHENFAMSVAEALAAGTPAIVTKGAPWSGLTTHRCGWWVDHGVRPLVHAIREAMTMPSAQLREMGHNARNWMLRDFGWDKIADEMLEAYAWAAHGGTKPTCVST